MMWPSIFSKYSVCSILPLVTVCRGLSKAAIDNFGEPNILFSNKSHLKKEAQADIEAKVVDKSGSTESLKETSVSFTRIKRKKFAVLLSYNGKDYKGMQW